MKKTSKKSKRSGTQKDRGVKKASYIGAAVAVLVGGIGMVTLMRLSDLSQTLEQGTPIVLPSPAPVETRLPRSELPDTTPAPAPTQTAPPAVAEAPIEEPPAAAAVAAPAKLQLVMPAEGEIMIPYSADQLIKSKTMGDWRVHSGVDIKSAIGGEVKAAADGVVERAFSDPQMGYTIVIAHSGDYKTVYQNLASVEMVQEGMTVVRGQGIAAVGNSASAELLEEAHLHFAVLAGEDYQNPLDYME